MEVSEVMGVTPSSHPTFVYSDLPYLPCESIQLLLATSMTMETSDGPVAEVGTPSIDGPRSLFREGLTEISVLGVGFNMNRAGER